MTAGRQLLSSVCVFSMRHSGRARVSSTAAMASTARVVWRVASGLACAVALAGCAASNSQYYSLQTVSDSRPKAVNSIADALNVQSVSIPAQVDRPQLVLAGRTDGAVSVMNDSLWVAPLADEIRLAVASRLGQQLGVPDVNGTGAPANLPLWGVKLDIQRFEAMYGKYVQVQTSWRLSRRPETKGDGLPIVCRANVQVPAVGGVDATVRAYQQALVQVADMIAAQVAAGRLGDNAGMTHPKIDLGSGLTWQGCSGAAD